MNYILVEKGDFSASTNLIINSITCPILPSFSLYKVIISIYKSFKIVDNFDIFEDTKSDFIKCLSNNFINI